MTAAGNRLHGGVGNLRVLLRLRRAGAHAGELLDVRPRGKGLVARAAQHDAAQVIVGRQRLERLRQALPHAQVERVQLVGVVQRDGGDALVVLDQDGLSHGLYLLFDLVGCRWMSAGWRLPQGQVRCGALTCASLGFPPPPAKREKLSGISRKTRARAAMKKTWGRFK